MCLYATTAIAHSAARQHQAEAVERDVAAAMGAWGLPNEAGSTVLAFAIPPKDESKTTHTQNAHDDKKGQYSRERSLLLGIVPY